ncbi:hypothetical protein [Hymenobacter saemangeumensis]
MKNSLTAFLPALALLALSGCASTGAIATSEDDGVYYSSKDRSTAIVTPAPAAEAPAGNEAANPDYNGNASTRSNGGSTASSQDYYDDTYTSTRRTYVYAGPGVAYYTPVVYAPYTTLSYGISPYGPAFYDPFYSPFYSPFYGYGPSVSINIGYGRPWGWGRHYGAYYDPYYGYASPWGYGYAGYYDPYFYGGRYYGGYYGPRGYYGNSYYGNSYYGNAYYGDRNRAPITSRHRADRMSSGGRVSSASSGSGTNASTGGGRVRTGGRSALTEPGTPQPMETTPEGGRVRSEAAAAMPASYTSPEPVVKPQRNRDEKPQQFGTVDQPANQPVRMSAEEAQPGRNTGRGRWRDAELNQQLGQSAPEPQPQPAVLPEGERKPRREYNQAEAPANTGYATPEGYSRPAEQQPARRRTYEAPRSYEQPQRNQQPAYSAPSYSAPSNDGGSRGSSGGGRSRGRAD